MGISLAIFIFQLSKLIASFLFQKIEKVLCYSINREKSENRSFYRFLTYKRKKIFLFNSL